LIVSGSLRSGPWLCDKCNVRLSKGGRAMLAIVYPRSITEGISEYDFAYERRYFDMEQAETSVFGAEWPVVMVARSGRRAGRAPRQRRLCALDLKPRQPEHTE